MRDLFGTGTMLLADFTSGQSIRLVFDLIGNFKGGLRINNQDGLELSTTVDGVAAHRAVACLRRELR